MWTRVGGGTVTRKRQRVDLGHAAGKRFRYYLVWITELPAGDRARRDLRARLFRDRLEAVRRALAP